MHNSGENVFFCCSDGIGATLWTYTGWNNSVIIQFHRTIGTSHDWNAKLHGFRSATITVSKNSGRVECYSCSIGLTISAAACVVNIFTDTSFAIVKCRVLLNYATLQGVHRTWSYWSCPTWYNTCSFWQRNFKKKKAMNVIVGSP